MAKFVDKFKRMWEAPDDEYDYSNSDDGYYDGGDERDDGYAYGRYEEEKEPMSQREENYNDYSNRRDAVKVVDISTTARLHVALFKPIAFGEEIKEIANELIKSHTVVINLEDTNKDVSRRILDFLYGVVYASKGHIQRASSSTVIITPNNVELTGEDLMGELENNGLFY